MPQFGVKLMTKTSEFTGESCGVRVWEKEGLSNLVFSCLLLESFGTGNARIACNGTVKQA